MLTMKGPLNSRIKRQRTAEEGKGTKNGPVDVHEGGESREKTNKEGGRKERRRGRRRGKNCLRPETFAFRGGEGPLKTRFRGDTRLKKEKKETCRRYAGSPGKAWAYLRQTIPETRKVRFLQGTRTRGPKGKVKEGCRQTARKYTTKRKNAGKQEEP